MNVALDAMLYLASVIMLAVTIREDYMHEPGLGGHLAQHPWWFITYFAIVILLLATGVNRRIVYTIAAPLFLVVLFLLPIGFFMGT